MLYIENSSMHHYVGFSKIGSAGSDSNCKRLLVYYVSVVDAIVRKNQCSIVSWVDTSKQVLVDCSPLVTHCYTRNSLAISSTLHFSRDECQYCLYSLITRLSNHFSWGKFVSECGVASEWYRIYLITKLSVCGIITYMEVTVMWCGSWFHSLIDERKKKT